MQRAETSWVWRGIEIERERERDKRRMKGGFGKEKKWFFVGFLG